MSGYSGAVNVKWFGAKGDGVTLDTVAIQAAIDSGLPVLFPNGNYISDRILTNRSNVHIEGQGHPTITAAPGTTGNLLEFTGNSIFIENFDFVGPMYSAFGDSIALDTLVRIENLSGTNQVKDITVNGCNFFGGVKSLVLTSSLRATLDGIRVYKPYQWGVIVQLGPQKLIINNLRAEEVGLYEGLKFGSGSQTYLCQDVLVDQFLIERCGRLDPNMSNWQEGLDLLLQSGRYIKVSNGIIRNCGNGGIEIKKGASTVIPDIYEEVSVSNVAIEIDTDHGVGVAINYNGSAASPNLAKSVKLRGVDVTYTGGGIASSAYGYIVQAWTDFESIGGTLNGVHNGIRFDGIGSSDNTVRRPSIRGLKTRNVHAAVVFANGSLENLTIDDSDLESTGSTVFIESGTAVVKNSRLQSDTDHAITGAPSLVEATGNKVSVPSTKRTMKLTGGAYSATKNLRGFDTSKPTMAASLGDEVVNTAAAAGGYGKWVPTTEGDVGTVVWKGTELRES